VEHHKVEKRWNYAAWLLSHVHCKENANLRPSNFVTKLS
jgi:hypothetical protein